MRKQIFIERLNNELQKREISQNKLATYTNLSPSLITRYLNGERIPSDNSIVKVAYFLKLNPEYLKGESDDKNPPKDLKKQYDKVIFEEENTADLPTYAYRLAELIEENDDINKTGLAKIINLSINSVSNYTRGTREPNIKTLITICDYFNVSIDYLVGRTNVKNNNTEDLLFNEILMILDETKLVDALNNNTSREKILKLFKKTCEIYKLPND